MTLFTLRSTLAIRSTKLGPNCCYHVSIAVFSKNLAAHQQYVL